MDRQLIARHIDFLFILNAPTLQIYGFSIWGKRPWSTKRPTDRHAKRPALSVRRRRLHLAGFLGKQCSAGHQ